MTGGGGAPAGNPTFQTPGVQAFVANATLSGGQSGLSSRHPSSYYLAGPAREAQVLVPLLHWDLPGGGVFVCRCSHYTPRPASSGVAC